MSSIHMAISRRSLDCDESIDSDEIECKVSDQQELQSSKSSLTSLRKPSLTNEDAIESNIRVMTPQTTERKRPLWHGSNDDEMGDADGSYPDYDSDQSQEYTNLEEARAIGAASFAADDKTLRSWHRQMHADVEQPSCGENEAPVPWSSQRIRSLCIERFTKDGTGDTSDEDVRKKNQPRQRVRSFCIGAASPTKEVYNSTELSINTKHSSFCTPTGTHRRLRYSNEFLGQTIHSTTTASESADDDDYNHPGAVAVKSRRNATTSVAAHAAVLPPPPPPPLLLENAPPLVYGITTDPSLLMVSARIVRDQEVDDTDDDDHDHGIEAPPLHRTATRSSDDIRQEILSQTVQATEVKIAKRWLHYRKTWQLISLLCLVIILSTVYSCRE